MSEQEILILLNALDNASKTIADASSNVKASLGQVEGAAAQVEKTQRKHLYSYWQHFRHNSG
jgi:hypothetical protein